MLIKSGVKNKTEIKIDRLWTARSMLYIAHLCARTAIKSNDEELLLLAQWFKDDSKRWRTLANL